MKPDRLTSIEASLKELLSMQKFLLSHKNVFSLSEASKYCGLSESTLYKLTSQRKIKHSKPGGKMISIKRTDLEAWMLTNPVTSKDELETKAANYNFSKQNKRAS